MRRGSKMNEPSDYFPLMVLLLPRGISAHAPPSGSRGTCGSVTHRFRDQTHRLQPLRTLQRDESHRLLLFCRSVV
jgi:hypothetical protein